MDFEATQGNVVDEESFGEMLHQGRDVARNLHLSDFKMDGRCTGGRGLSSDELTRKDQLKRLIISLKIGICRRRCCISRRGRRMRYLGSGMAQHNIK